MNGIVFVLLRFSQILFVSAQKNQTINLDNWSTVIQRFANLTDNDICSTTLLNIIKKTSSSVNQNFMETWKSSTPFDLYSLNFYNEFGEDMKCKMNRPDAIEDDFSNRYCLYEIYNDNLTDGFLFGVCIPPTCKPTDVETLGSLVYERDKLKDNRNYGVKPITECSRRAILDTCEDWRVGVVAFISVLPVFLASVATIISRIK